VVERPPPFAEHPDRRQVVAEMHLRRFPTFELPAQIVQLVRVLDEEERQAEALCLKTLPGTEGLATLRHREGRWSREARVGWERHSEASTVTLTITGPHMDWTCPEDGPEADALQWIEAMPGHVVRATRLLIVQTEEEAESLVESAGFRLSQLVSCYIGRGARLWSDFRVHDDGYGRLVLAANNMVHGDLLRSVQRLQELGNYRNLALLGLPVARAAWARLDTIEQNLAATGRALLAGDRRDDTLLEDLTSETQQLLALAAECDFRMSATAAYGEIAADRLEELDVLSIEGFPSLADFTERRLNPAVRTCASLSRRLSLLNGRAAQFTGLLRTRIETHIENQNARLLASMDRSARLQLQLQHLVEGLSAVAISYYLIGLLAYPVKALEKVHIGISSTLLLGIIAPFVVALVAFALHAMRQRLSRGGHHD
jgi:uncharacterized membrane-anchored protein